MAAAPAAGARTPAPGLLRTPGTSATCSSPSPADCPCRAVGRPNGRPTAGEREPLVRHRSWLAGISAAALVATGTAVVFALGSDHDVGSDHDGAKPGHAGVYAPYFKTWTRDSIPVIASRSGVRDLTLAFIQAAGKKGAAACTVTWDGVRKQPISAGRDAEQIARLRQHGGDAIPSFDGFRADQGVQLTAPPRPRLVNIGSGAH